MNKLFVKIQKKKRKKNLTRGNLQAKRLINWAACNIISLYIAVAAVRYYCFYFIQ